MPPQVKMLQAANEVLHLVHNNQIEEGNASNPCWQEQPTHWRLRSHIVLLIIWSRSQFTYTSKHTVLANKPQTALNLKSS